jgi:hypothetical protein
MGEGYKQEIVSRGRLKEMMDHLPGRRVIWGEPGDGETSAAGLSSYETRTSS